MSAREIARAVLEARKGGPAVLVATLIAAPEAYTLGAKILISKYGTTIGSIDGGMLDETVRQGASDAFRQRGVEIVYLDRNGERIARREADEAESFQLMLEIHERPETLLIIGAGHVGKALATIGHLCGFSVEVVDDRPEYANEERFPEVDRITCGRFDEVLQDYPITPNTYVVCVTRGHRHDETGLRLVVGRGAAYVGMIGSRRRVGAVLQHLVEEGLDSEAVERVHTPIGLDIGAETPEEIAVSVMAEIVMVRRGGTGAPMREAKGRRR